MNRRPLEAFRLGLVGVALAAGATAWAVARPAALDWRLALTLAAFGVATTQFPLHLSLTHKVSGATAVFFAAALLFPAPVAAALAAGSDLVSTAVFVVRRTVATRQPPPPAGVVRTAAFNAAQAFVAVLAASLVLAAGHVSARSLGAPGAPFVVLGAALTMYVANLAAVSTAVGLSGGTSPLRVFVDTQHAVALQFSALYGVGTVFAWLTSGYPWVPVLAVVPGVLVHLSLRHAVQLSQETVRAVERMAEMVDRRDPYTYEHSRRVSDYSMQIARRLGLSRDEVELLRLAGHVHDLGKIGIPDSVLLKPGRLDPDEEEQMRMHPRIGHDILAEFREYSKVRELVLTHHERFAGGGYPTGIVAGGLPLVAQVIPVADSLDAMTTARPYRGPLSWAIALAELEAGAGRQWNPRVVAAALAVFAHRGEPLPAPQLVAV